MIEHIRGDESVNLDTPIVFRFPEMPETYSFGMGDDLTKEAIRTDMNGKGPVDVIYGTKIEAVVERVREITLDCGRNI